MSRETIILGNRTFCSKTRAEQYLRQIKDSYRPGDFLTGDESVAVLDALQRHPACAEKVGLGIRRVGLYANGETRSGYGFGVERVGGTVARFSYHICFAAERRSHADRVCEALRHAVRPHILVWRDRTFAKHNGRMNCPITGAPLDLDAFHVDHFSPSFTELVQAFLANEALTLDSVSVEVSHHEQVEAMLSDIGLKQRWIRFHNQKVSLRIVSIDGHRFRHHQLAD